MKIFYRLIEFRRKILCNLPHMFICNEFNINHRSQVLNFTNMAT